MNKEILKYHLRLRLESFMRNVKDINGYQFDRLSANIEGRIKEIEYLLELIDEEYYIPQDINKDIDS